MLRIFFRIGELGANDVTPGEGIGFAFWACGAPGDAEP
jgi:hypothetical protein